jgi:hypothetical protein
MMALEPNNVPTATSSLLSSSFLLLVLVAVAIVVSFEILSFIGIAFDILLAVVDHAPILCK